MRTRIKYLAVAAAFLAIGCNNDDSGVNGENTQTQACETDGQIKCGDTCIDPKTDMTYCGADEKCEHYNTCDTSTQKCDAGTCIPVEQPKACETDGQVKCGDTCIDPKSDMTYCGADETCEHYNTCDTSTQKCDAGTCVPNSSEQPKACETDGQVKCGDTCIDPKSDMTYCGADETCEHYTTCDEKHLCDGGTCKFNYATVKAEDPSFATDDGIPDGISFRLINKTGIDICFSGKFKPYIKKNGPENAWLSTGQAAETTQELECHITPPTSTDDGWPHWHVNNITLAPDEYKEFSLTEFKEYAGNGSQVQTIVIPMDTYANGEWYFVADDNTAAGGPGVKLGFAAKEPPDGKRSNSAYIIHVKPVKASDAKIEKGKKYNMIIDKADTASKYWYCD